MKKGYINTNIGLPKGFPCSQYENLKEIVTAVKGDEAQVTDIVNKYLRQKGPLVEGRDLLSTHVEDVCKYPMKTEKAKRKIDDKEVEVTVPTETEGKHLDRFVADMVKGTFTVPGVALSGNEEQKEAGVWAYLQTVADKFDLSVDAAKPEKSSKPKSYEKLPQYARKGAESIIANGTQAKWVATFTKEQVPFEDFQQKDSPDENKLHLAQAIVERENKQAKPAYA